MASESNLPTVVENYAICTLDPARMARRIESGQRITNVDAFGLPVIKVPSGDGRTFLLPQEDGSDPVDARTFDVVILSYTQMRMRRLKSYKEATEDERHAPPTCSSFDGVYGVGDPGGECAQCRFYDFGSQCHPGYFAYVIFPENLIPIRLQIPRTSIGAFENYIKIQLGLRFYDPHQVKTRVGLAKRVRGDGMVLTFTMLHELPEVQAATIGKYAELFTRSLSYRQASVPDDPTAPHVTPQSVDEWRHQEEREGTAQKLHTCGTYCAGNRHFEDDKLFGTREVYVGTLSDGRMVVQSYGTARPQATVTVTPDDDDLPE